MRFYRDGSHRDNFGESLETSSSVQSQLWVSFQALDFFDLAYGFLWPQDTIHDTKMLLKVVFDKTVFVKFKISNKFKQNIDETHSKQPKLPMKIHTSKWILKISRKNPRPRCPETFAKSL